MLIKKLRLQRGWSQEHLSQVSGLSVRTIQRIERGQKAGLESLKSLAAVFEVDISSLQQEADMTTQASQASTSDINNKTAIQVTMEEQRAMEYVQGLKAFYGHLATYLIVNIVLFAVNWFITPGYLWVLWVMMGWGVGLASHAVGTFELFNFFDAEWEKRQVEKRLGRDL